MSKEKRSGREFPHVAGLAKKRTKFGHRWILTEQDFMGKSRSITVKILDNDPIDVFYKKITAARHELRLRAQCKTIDAYLREYSVIKQLAPSTIKFYRRCVGGFSFDERQNKKRVHEILAMKLKPSSMRLYISTVDTFFKWLIQRGEAVKNPVCDVCIKAKTTPRKRIFNEEEMQILLSYARSRSDKSYTLFILLLIETGARISTICALKLDSLDSDGTIHLYNAKCRKNYDYDLKIQNDEIYRLWKARVSIGKLWNEPPGKYWQRLVQWMHRRFKRDQNGELLSPHSIRHTFASRAIRNGVPLEIVSKLLDHASPVMTLKVYARFSQEQINDAMAKATKKAPMCLGQSSEPS